MSHWHSVKGDKPWVGVKEAKSDGRVTRRQVDRAEIEAGIAEYIAFCTDV